MRLVLTLLCRNEEDIIASILEYYLRQGVDFIIATDNSSEDGTAAILQRYEKKGLLRLLHQPELTHDQSVWVTGMARLAAREHGADWIINGDADEFWWPRRGDLKDVLAAAPSDVAALAARRSNFVPPPVNHDAQAPFHARMLVRETLSLNVFGRPLPPKVCHRANPDIEVADGNHAVRRSGADIVAPSTQDLEILHFPMRNYAQFERKIRQGARALESNDRVSPETGSTWRRLYREYFLKGRLEEYYSAQAPTESELDKGLRTGSLVHDDRLHEFLRAPSGGREAPSAGLSRSVGGSETRARD